MEPLERHLLHRSSVLTDHDACFVMWRREMVKKANGYSIAWQVASLVNLGASIRDPLRQRHSVY